MKEKFRLHNRSLIYRSVADFVVLFMTLIGQI